MRVADIQTNPTREVTLQSRQPLIFTAVPVDVEGGTVQGLPVEWQSRNNQVLFIKKNGQAMAGRPGTTIVTARAGNQRKSVTVTVVEAGNERYGGKKRQDSVRRSEPVGTSVRQRDNFIAQKPRGKKQRAHASILNAAPAVPVTPLPIRNPDEDPLPDGETSSLYQPGNLIGAPAGKKKQGAQTAASAIPATESGNKNFSFGLPVASLPGRGIDVSLSLIYNSLLWNKSTDSYSNTWLTYDVDAGYPAQGFRLGFGQIEDQGSAGFTLTDPNGTRHALVYSSAYTYETNDGTFIRYIGGSGWGTLYYPDGSQVTYGAAGTNGQRTYPTQILDRNGNYILINYVNGVGPRISTIQDTLCRYVRFYYDSNNELVTVTAPGLSGQSDNQVMRFYYDTLSLTTANLFSGVNVSKPNSARVLKYVYLPSSAEGSSASDGDTGYRFDYSPYGMIYRIVKFQGMTASTTSTSDIGTVTEGTIASTTEYGYPTSAASLSDAPTYSSRSDEWAGRTSGGSAPQYSFAVVEGSSETISRVTAPDGTVTETVTIKHTGYWDDGLVKEMRVQNIASPTPSPSPTPTVYARTTFEWEQNSTNNTPRLSWIKQADENNRTRATVLSYDSSTPYNNVSKVSERDFTDDGSLGTELRHTDTTYVTSSSYLNRRLLHLPASVKVYKGLETSTPTARVDYEYDNYGSSHANLTARDDISMHSTAFDPFQDTQEVWDWVCTQWGYNQWEIYDCLNWEWQLVSYYNPYDSATDYRGNVTGVTTYPDASTTSGAITHSTTYDIAGNVMTKQVDCCQSMAFTYSNVSGLHDYAYPISVTKGNPSGTYLTTSATYDMNTGLVASTTDENSQTTNFYYNTDTLRLDYVGFPDGGQISYDYGDALVADSASKYHSRLTVTTKLDSTRNVDSKSYFDGRGALAASFDSYTSTDGWAIRNIEYDSMGRAYRASNPYHSTSDYGTVAINSSGIWTTSTFDYLSRVTQVTMPRGDDANPTYTTSMQTSYSGEFITVTDQAGKQRRQQFDALGRLIRLDEPNSSGALGSTTSANQKTEYTYDVLNNLVKILQGDQTRYFKYDSLSRLIRDRQAEQDTNSSYNLSDALTGNSSWSRKFEYNSHGLLTYAHDARGVQSHFYYDDLNRLTLIDYSDSTPDARYFYDSQTLPSGAPSYTHGSANGRLIALTYGSSSSTSGTYFGYDVMGRVNVQKQVTGGNTYGLSYSYNHAGLLVNETYPSGRVLTHSYDNAGRLSQISDGTTSFTSALSYAPGGGMLFGNVGQQRRAFDRL